MAEGKINGNLKINDGSTDYRTLKELNNLVTTLSKGPGVATARMSGRKEVNVPVAWTGHTIPLDNIITNRSTLFELSSNGIKIKKAIKALVSFQATRYGSPNTGIGEFDISASIGDSVIVNGYGHSLDNNLVHYNGSPILVDISANSIIQLRCGVGGTGKFRFIGDNNATFLTIQEVFK